MDKLNILLPVETINRELDSRFLMAVHLLEPDRRIVVAQHDLLARLLPYMRGGVWLGKNVFPREAPWETYERYHAVRARDFVVVHLDEEGAVFPGEPELWPKWIYQRLDVTRLDARDWVCTWGDFQKEIYQKVSPDVSATLLTTGHPRFDLCRADYRWYFEPEVEALRRRFGSFVLFNTNLTYANPGSGPSLTFDVSSGWDVTSPVARLNHLRWYTHTSRVLTGFLSLMNRVSLELPDLTVIVRPHPSESFELYQAVFRGVPNVHVVHEGSVLPWILASTAMIHDGSTTGVEGSLTGKPVINFKPLESLEFDPQLPNALGLRCETEDEVLGVLRRLLAGEAVTSRPLPDIARRMLVNYDRPALPAVVQAVSAAAAGVDRRMCGFNRRAIEAVAQGARLTSRARSVFRAIGPRTLRRRMTEPRFVQLANQMFYGFSRRRVSEQIRRIAEHAGRTARVRYVTEELFFVEAE